MRPFVLKTFAGKDEQGNVEGSFVLLRQEDREIIAVEDFHGEELEIEGVSFVSVPSEVEIRHLASPQRGEVIVVGFNKKGG